MRVLPFFVAPLVVVVASCAASRDDAHPPGTQPPGDDAGFSPDVGGFNGDAPANDTPPVKSCKVDESGDGVVGTCTKSAPPKSFDPRVKWTWSEPTPAGTMRGPDGTIYATISGSITTPLVGNFTDDNGDGAIDLCDVPDVLVTVMEDMLAPTNAKTSPTSSGSAYLLSGDTGKTLFTLGDKIDPNITPAFGDIDGDGLPEIVAGDPDGRLVAFETDGKVKWRSDVAGWKQAAGSYCHAIAIYDLDGDGAPEILAAFEVFDATGKKKFGVPGNGSEWAADDYWCPTPTAADLDGDGKLEVIFGSKAYRADGTLYFDVPGPPGAPHVANVDDDPEPEIVLATSRGVLILEQDGRAKGPAYVPAESPPPAGWSETMGGAHCWGKPGAITDLDGDGHAEFAYGSCSFYSSDKFTSASLSPSWSDPVTDLSGLATGTAFDFLGRGVADAIYADEHHAYVFDGLSGATELTTQRTSGTLIEYPVVADVDSDGSADFVVVSNYFSASGMTGFDRKPSDPTVTAYSDASNRWIPARRIWNQHAYHVTNVREDGTIPKTMKNNWQLLNTFRTNAQIESGSSCAPPHPR